MRPPEKTRQSVRLGALPPTSLGVNANQKRRSNAKGREGADTITRPQGPWNPQALLLSFTEGSAFSRGQGCTGAAGAAQGPPEDGGRAAQGGEWKQSPPPSSSWRRKPGWGQWGLNGVLDPREARVSSRL